MSLTYAIGDVHGRRDLLAALLGAIRDDTGGRAFRIVFLGDLIDRGPESRACIDIAIQTLAAHPGSRLILGNHEEFLLSFVDDPEARERVAARWFANGGLETLKSYGIGETERIDTVAARLARDVPEHLALLRAADFMVETGTYAFVHGGIDPDLPLDRQDPHTTRWIRNRFLDHRGPLPKMIVHGHTITEAALPELHANRIALDTGAVMTGHLTCGIFDGDTRPRFLATDDHCREIEVTAIRPLDCR